MTQAVQAPLVRVAPLPWRLVSRPMTRALLCIFALAALSAGEARSAFYNQKVSAREVALNQPVRIELTTIPRQIEGVDVVASVGDAIALATSGQWRLVGKATLATDEKTRTIRVSATLLARSTGDTLALSPPLIVSRAEIDRLIEGLGNAIRAAA